MTQVGARILKSSIRENVVTIPLEDINSVLDPGFHRSFNEKLAKSLELKGMLNPILVCTDEVFKTTDIRSFERRAVPGDIDETYRCLIGNNRYKYAEDNGYTHIDCVIVSSLQEVKELHRATEIPPSKM